MFVQCLWETPIRLSKTFWNLVHIRVFFQIKYFGVYMNELMHFSCLLSRSTGDITTHSGKHNSQQL